MGAPIWAGIVGAVVLVAIVAFFLTRPGEKTRSAERQESERIETSTIDAALADGRADLAVSEWLALKFNHTEDSLLPREVLNAYRSDRFVAEVNSGGHLGFFDWEGESAKDTVLALRAIGLEDVADQLQKAMDLVAPGGWPDSENGISDARIAVSDDEKRTAQIYALDELLFADSGRIEDVTHAYVRAHIEVFRRLDGG
jgi:hypothetical protein